MPALYYSERKTVQIVKTILRDPICTVKKNSANNLQCKDYSENRLCRMGAKISVFLNPNTKFDLSYQKFEYSFIQAFKNMTVIIGNN